MPSLLRYKMRLLASSSPKELAYEAKIAKLIKERQKHSANYFNLQRQIHEETKQKNLKAGNLSHRVEHHPLFKEMEKHGGKSAAATRKMQQLTENHFNPKKRAA